MKHNKRAWLLLIALCILAGSCKLDPPVLPGDAGYVATVDPNAPSTETVTGTIVSGSTINNANLTATWKVANTTQQFYDANDVVVSYSTVPNIYTTVTLNDQAKTANFVGFAPAAQTYVLSTTGGVLYIQLSADPFSRSYNSPVRITNLSATAMTWVAIDPTLISLGGQLLHKAYQITYTK